MGTRIIRTVDRLLAMVEPLTDDQARWTPSIPGWNSLAVIVTHVLANLEENVCAVIGGETVTRFREDEFYSPINSAVGLVEAWRALRPRIAATIDSLESVDMPAERSHPRRGAVSVREALMVVMAHAALHEGHAEMTWDFLLTIPQ